MDATIEGEKLSEVYDKIWNTYKYLETSEEPTNSDNVQDRVEDATVAGEKAVAMVNELSLFSTNEDLEEVSTTEIKYLLLPALLGYMSQRNTRVARLEALEKAQVYFARFIILCRLYGATNAKPPKLETDQSDSQQSDAKSGPSSSSAGDLKSQVAERQRKIEQFKRKREAEQKLKDLEQRMAGLTVDDEILREYHMSLLKSWVHTSLDELDSIKQEIPILQHMAKRAADKAGAPDEKSKPTPPKLAQKRLQPFILTRDKIQAQVIGAGYPSLPTYSVEEWYQQQVDSGKFPAPGTTTGSTVLEGTDSESDRQRQEEEAAERERKEETDDRDSLRKAREWDDWKDDHRRGWGNTQNKG